MKKWWIGVVGAVLVVVAAFGSSAGMAATGAAGATAPSDTYGDLPGEVVFQTLNGDHESIWLIEPDGTNERIILGQDHWTAHPRWSFDGEHLVYTDCTDTDGCALTIVDADGSNPTVAYSCGPTCYGGDGAALSPDGTLAFTRYFGGDPAVEAPSHAALTVGPPGGPFVDIDSTRQFPTGVSDQFPRWSPDGTHLVFYRERYRDEAIVGAAVFTIAADGTDLRRLTPWSMNAGNPDWSADGKRIAFNTYPIVDFETGPSDIYTVRPNGKHLQRITHSSAKGYRADQPTFAAGHRVIFFTLETAPGTKQLWAMRSDGTNKAQITTTGLYTHAQLQPR
jgi:Tol biopolymer transport system component